MNNSLDFSGKVALVTGAATGMGLATARAFAEAGAAVVLADFKEEVVKAEAKNLVAAGHKAIAVRCDVSDDAQVAAMVDRAVAAAFLGADRRLHRGAGDGRPRCCRVRSARRRVQQRRGDGSDRAYRREHP